LRAILDRNSGFLTDKFIVRALIAVLKAPPSAHVINEDDFEVCAPRRHVVDERFESVSSVKPQSAFACILIASHDGEPSLRSISRYSLGLIFEGVSLHVC